jgi:hypothetical protein
MCKSKSIPTSAGRPLASDRQRPLRAPLSARTPLSRGPDPVVADLSERKCFGSPKFGA